MRHSGNPDQLGRLCGRGRDDKCHRVGVADVFGRRDHDPPGEEPRVFPRLEHAGQPVRRRIGIAAAHAFDEGAGRVVMLVARRIVLNRLLLDRVLGHNEIDRLVRLGCREDGDLKGIERPPGVAVGDFREKIERLLRNRGLMAAQSPLRVGQRAM